MAFEAAVAGPGERALIHRGGESIKWRVIGEGAE
jgi:hypothetical protein